MEKFYFNSITSNICYPLKEHVSEAINDGLSEITLIKAELDKENNRTYVWCNNSESPIAKTECNKFCDFYARSSGRFCDFRRKLYLHGEEIRVKIN